MITVSGLSKSFGARELFSNVTFRLLPGRRVALVGGNGVGKTTLLEIVVGIGDADQGTVHRNKDLRVGYLPQELEQARDISVLQEVMSGADHITELERRLTGLMDIVASSDASAAAAALDEYGELQSRFEQLGGYALESSARRILHGLGFSDEDADRPITELSGGWQMRAALARLMLSRPDVLVLDEPTNHLDTDSIAWLESELAAYEGAILFVSHDRDFIDAVAERVIEVAGGTALEYIGGFAEFVVQREERLVAIRAAAAQQSRELAKVERFVERFRYKATKAKQVQSRLKTLEKLERIEVPDTKQLRAKFGFPEPRRSGRVVIEVCDASVGYDEVPVLRDINLVVERGQKLALVGPNGAGKSTLLKLLLGQLQPMSGTCELGSNVDVAYFAQHQVEMLDLTKTVAMEFTSQIGEQPKTRNIRTVLGSFGFSGDAADRRIGDLSGGEQTRLALAICMANPVNLLILDEPTNHLDLPSCDLLGDALSVYPGTVVLVSHDRYLIRETAHDLLEVRGGAVKFHAGVDESVLTPSFEGGTTGPASTATTKPKPSARRGETKRVEAEHRNARHSSTKELKKELSKIERDLAASEQLVADLNRQLADPEVYSDADQATELAVRFGEAKDRAGALMDRWVQVSSELERSLS